MNIVTIFALMFISTIFLTSCASITRGIKETIIVYAWPEDSKIFTDIGESCASTPCSFEIPRNAKFVLTASRKGYKTKTVNITTEIVESGVVSFVGNILIGGIGIVGAGVDSVTGAVQNHKPNPVIIELDPINPNNPETQKGDLSHIKQRYKAMRNHRNDVLMRRENDE